MVTRRQAYKPKSKDTARSQSITRMTKEVRCKFCNRLHELRKESCPAWRKTCAKCKGRNHFAIVCKAGGKRKVHAVYQGTDQHSDNEYALISKAGQTTGNPRLIYAKMRVNNKLVRFQVDCGASVFFF